MKQKSNRKNREENQVGKKGRPKLKGKKIKWGRREREGGKGITKKKGKGKTRQRREDQEKGSDYWTEKVAKLRRKGREK